MTVRARLRRRFRRLGIRVGTANIRNNPDMPRPWVRADAAAMGRESDVLLLQEIGEREDIKDVKAALGPGFRLRHRHLPVPIAFRWRKFKLIDEGWAKLHDGSARVPNPDRFVAWVILRRRFRPWSKPVVYVNTHWVNGAWNEKSKPHKAWRRRMWAIDYAKCQALVLKWHEQGLTVFIGGDLNRLKVDRFHPDQMWLWNVGICKLAVIPAQSTPVERVGARGVRLHSDHPGAVASANLLPEEA